MFLPINLNLKGKECLVVGAGFVAERKIHSLLLTGARIFVVADEVLPVIRELHNKGSLRLFKRAFKLNDLKDKFLVIIATDNKKVNNSIAKLCRGRKIIVNVVDSIMNSDFIFPAYFNRGNLVIAVSTQGESPSLAVKIRDDLKKYFGDEYEEFIREVSVLRKNIVQNVKSGENRKYLMDKILEDFNTLKLTKNKSIRVIKAKFRELLKNHVHTNLRPKS
jgi:precorrin-2 dehydrogenase / sirohydrochlorin ferrochelatase